MVNKTIKKVLPIILGVLLLFSALPLQFIVSATTVNVLDGQVSITDSANSNTVSGGTVTIKASGSMFTKKTNNITVTNETASKAKITFDYVADKANSFKIAGATASASGSYSVVLDAGASLAITLVSNSGLSNTTATLTLSNFNISVVADSSEITFNYDGDLGDITVDGDTVSPGGLVEVSGSTGAALVATTKTGADFLGWIDDSGMILSSSKEFTFTPAATMTVKAVFVGEGSNAWFGVGGKTAKQFSYGLLGMQKGDYSTVTCNYLFDDLNLATQNASGKVVVLMNNSTLPQGDYTIPSGVTLLIPFDIDNTFYTTAAQSSGTYTTPTAYRTLTLASGANITVNGAISVSAKHRYAQGKYPTQGGGTPVGSVGFIKMSDSSNITVNNGGALYVYGFITGKGNITAENGATVYENFQIMDFRGGTESTGMKNGVFPTSQYYVQNIECPLTIKSGAKEYGLTTINMSSAEFMSAVDFIGPSGSMFNLTSGYIVKSYDGTKDRLNIELNGNMAVSPINLTIGTSSINSKYYELGINGNITLNVKSDSNATINQDMAMLPGSEIFIAEGAVCTLGNGINFYIYDADEWGDYVFTKKTVATFSPVKYAPGRKYTRKASDLVDAKIQIEGTVDASAGYVYTTAGGANICSSSTGVVKTKIMAEPETVTYQYVQGTETYDQIPITPAKIKNADGTYLETGKSSLSTNAYVYKDGKWVCDYSYIDSESDVTGHTYETVVTEPTCTEGGYTTHTCLTCDHSYVDSQTTATGHSYTSVEQEVGCETDGYIEYTCVKCGDTYKENIVPALGHNYNAEVTESTCTEAGYTTHTCANCGDSYVDSETEATGHSYSDFNVDVEATHNKEGSKSATCGRCGDVKTEVIPVIVCDIDGDGITGKKEHLMMRKIILGLISFEVGTDEFTMFDMNDDGVINLFDYAWICRVLELNGVEL